MYNLDIDPVDNTTSILKMCMRGNSSGWIAVGFPSRPGNMVNSAAAVLKVCGTCPTGASIEPYYLSGTDFNDVVVNNRYNMTDFEASAADGVLSGSWKMKVAGGATSRRRRRLFQLIYSPSDFPMIFAAGNVFPSGNIQQHMVSDSTSNSVDLLLGLPGADSTGDDEELFTSLHIWFGLISWGFVIPVAVLTSREFKLLAPAWFIYHRILAVLGFLMGTATFVLGFYAGGGFNWETEYEVHRNLGITCTALALFQIFSLIKWIRPKKESKWRPYWYYPHAVFGYSATGIGISNIYYGIIHVEELGLWAWATYTGILGVVLLVALIMEVTNWKLRRDAKKKGWELMETRSRIVRTKQEPKFKTTMPRTW